MPLGFDWPIRFLQLATAYKAKLLCSGVFVSQREPESILTEDLGVDDLAPLRYVNSKIDFNHQAVTTSCFGVRRTARYRPGLGSSLVINTHPGQLQEQSQDFEQWHNTTPRSGIDLPVSTEFAASKQLQTVLDEAFTEKNAKRLKRTRAIVVLHKGHIIAERYAPGFSAQMPLLGWSMTKSVVNTLVGILVHQGKLSLQDSDLLSEWRQPGDPRCSITLDQMLRMCDGLRFSEHYGNPRADATTMLFQREDAASYAAGRPLENPPGGAFHYSSGTTVLLCHILRQAIGGDLTDYFMFPRKALFDPLGMGSAILEPDALGTFVGSSYLYATARDWAKFGLLYLQDGCWQGKRILPTGWVRYSITPNDIDPRYAAHFWRQVPYSFTSPDGPDYEWPKDAYLASGYQGQFVTIVPSADLVVVRLGLSQKRHSWDHPQFISNVLRTVGADR